MLAFHHSILLWGGRLRSLQNNSFLRVKIMHPVGNKFSSIIISYPFDLFSKLRVDHFVKVYEPYACLTLVLNWKSPYKLTKIIYYSKKK